MHTFCDAESQSNKHSSFKSDMHCTVKSSNHGTVKKASGVSVVHQKHNSSVAHTTQTSPRLYTTQQLLSAPTWSKFDGTEADWTSCLMTIGAPFKKSKAEPLGMPLHTTTTPDLKLFELNSSTLTMDSSARVLEGCDQVGCLGRTTVALSCIITLTTVMMMMMMADKHKGRQTNRLNLSLQAEYYQPLVDCSWDVLPGIGLQQL